MLSSLRSVENYPDRQVVRKALEPMRHPGGHKEKFAGGEWLSSIAAQEVSASLDHHVRLIARMRRLLVHAPGRIQPRRHRAVTVQNHVLLGGCRWQRGDRALDVDL